VYQCVHVVYVRGYVCISVCMLCMFVYMCVSASRGGRGQVCVFVCVCVCLCVFVCVSVRGGGACPLEAWCQSERFCSKLKVTSSTCILQHVLLSAGMCHTAYSYNTPYRN
jgi:hypothetical protein